jgi:excisionase family DNA binding protein
VTVAFISYIFYIAFIGTAKDGVQIMLAPLDHGSEPFAATDEEALIARQALAKLKPLAAEGTDIGLRIAQKPDVPLPARAIELIVDMLTAMADRKPVSVVRHDAELTTKQAADFLNVSRPYLVGLLDKGEIKHRVVGTHRRVLVADLMAYKQKSDEDRRAAIARMVAESQKLGLP